VTCQTWTTSIIMFSSNGALPNWRTRCAVYRWRSLMPNKPAWKRFETEVQQLLGLSSTVSSGNQFNDPGDGVNNLRIDQHPFPLIVDCKYTERASMSLKRDDLKQWEERSAEMGKRFAMPIRFARSPMGLLVNDYILLGLHDFAELLEFREDGQRAMDEGDWG
jgi:hypothetical protein